MDFDQQFIPAEKHDATYSYKKERGYFPAVASIENVPVYVENRNGNCSVKYNQLDTLKRIFGLLEEQGIKPSCCRMDCGSYIKEVCDWLEEKGIKFCIRAEQSEHLLAASPLKKIHFSFGVHCRQSDTYRTRAGGKTLYQT